MTTDGTDRQDVIQEAPLSHGQKALWFLQRLSPENPAYNLVFAARILTALDLRAWRAAYSALIDRHPVLRTTFGEEGGQPVQRVHRRADLSLRVEDASCLGEEQLGERLAREVYRPFDLGKGPLLRVVMLQRSGEETIWIQALHHIVTDMWSLALLLAELGHLYAAEVAGKPPALRPLQSTYIDHVLRQEKLLAGPEGQELWAYWRERLQGDLPVLCLPTDRPRPAFQTAHAAARTIRLGPGLTRALKDLGCAEGVRLFDILLTAFYVLLYRYTGQTDLLVGSPKASRELGNANVFGYFINPVVLRADLSAGPTFLDLLQTTHRSAVADFEHGAYPFPLLVEKLQPSRDPSRGSLFQVIFSWQKTTRRVDRKTMTAFALGEGGSSLELGGLAMTTLAMKERTTPTDLALLCAESEDDLVATIEYSVDLFDGATIERLLGHLQVLLKGILAEPRQSVNCLPLLTPQEEHRILVEWNEPAEKERERGEPARLVHDRIRAWAEQAPDSVALSFAGREMTYGELDRRSDLLASCLRQRGVRPETVVGVYMERSLELVVGLLGILKAGGAYLPLNPDCPPERLAFILSDARASLLLTRRSLPERLPEKPARRIRLDTEWEMVVQEGARRLRESGMPRLAGPDTLAYVIYTSGSTGTPKGVLVPHRAIGRHCRFMQSYYRLIPEDRVLQFASPAFDASLEQIFTALLSGARLCLRDVELWDPADFSRKIADLGLTVVNIPPAYWHEWAMAESRRAGPAPDLPLRLVIVGGDVLPPADLAIWRQAGFRSTRLINAYGPTETTITATAYEVADPPDGAFWHVPIGRPLAGRKAYVLGPHLQPVPVGVHGELHIGGDCLARGYLNRPELTAERFIPDPHSAGPSRARLYRTGDLARWLPDGNLDFLGRIDRQVKIHGIRIEPGEIEETLKRHPGIVDSVVLPAETPQGSRLVACLIARTQPRPSADELNEFLGTHLPACMIPTAYVFLDALPFTPGGKLDREALIRIARREATAQRAVYVPPRNEIEVQLTSLWARLLQVEKVGIHDSFFDLGGHSLLATQLTSRLRDLFSVELPLRRLFETPTIAGLALVIAQSLADQEEAQDLNRMLAEIEEIPNDQARDRLEQGKTAGGAAG